MSDSNQTVFKSCCICVSYSMVDVLIVLCAFISSIFFEIWYIGRFSWDTPIRFALSAEEIGSIVYKVTLAHATGKLLPLEYVRASGPPSQSNSQFADVEVAKTSADKVFRVVPHGDGSVKFGIDFELNGRGGLDPPTTKEAVRVFCGRNGIVFIMRLFWVVCCHTIL
jgi:hypothetical protein